MPKSLIYFLFAGLFSLLLLNSSVFANNNPPLGAAVITTNGDANIAVLPDQAQIEIGVVTQAPTAIATGAKNRVQQAAVLKAIKAILGEQADIRTTSYSLNPNYHYPRAGGSPTITSYTASNILQIKTERLAEVGKVIDSAMQAGANNINSLQFNLRDEQAVRLQAIRQAVNKAKTQAEALAQAGGLKIIGILAITQNQANVQPFILAMAARQEPAPTPIVLGKIEVTASVTLKAQAVPAPSTP